MRQRIRSSSLLPPASYFKAESQLTFENAQFACICPSTVILIWRTDVSESSDKPRAGVLTMIKRILALGGISMALAFGQGAGGRGGRGGAPVAVVEDPNPTLRKMFAYDVTIDPKFTPPKTPWG